MCPARQSAITCSSPWNRRPWHAAEIPGVNAIGTARAVATFYACWRKVGRQSSRNGRLRSPIYAKLQFGPDPPCRCACHAKRATVSLLGGARQEDAGDRKNSRRHHANSGLPSREYAVEVECLHGGARCSRGRAPRPYCALTKPSILPPSARQGRSDAPDPLYSIDISTPTGHCYCGSVGKRPNSLF